MKVKESTVAAALMVDLARYLERQGIPAADFWQGIIVDPSLLESPNARLPGSVVERIWDQAVRLSGDQDLGLHTAENFNPGALNLLGYVILSCRTASEVLGRLAQYSALLNDGLRVRIVKEGAQTICRFEVATNFDNYLLRSPRHALETMACGTLVTLRRLTSTEMKPLRVAFQHPEPASTTEHLRIFGNVAFGQPETAMEFRSADLDGTLLSANPVLLDMFDAQAKQLLNQMEQRGPVSRKVLDFLVRRITVAVPTLDEVAAELGMSERTIQRELRVENTSFRQLIEDTRKEIAMQHLAQPGASASEAAFLLGFSEPSAFTRAFRRWTGSAPTQFQSV
ncbi:MAG: AraC family transcriptional regulator [Bryobacteraceae bacterium]